jgi:Kef-type K+ transport system membrane component KefB/nucleotide-binding universal stress UspA family protein
MTQPFTAASHHDVLVLVTQVAVLLLVARAFGEIAQRLRQPSVVGEILAGIVLGPSVLSALIPLFGDWLVPQTQVQGYLLETVSLIGAMFLLLITGLETDLALIRRHVRTAIGVSFGGIAVTFSSGFLLGQALPDYLLAEGASRLVFSLFVATALSISAIPVIAKVLMDLNLMRRDIGQTIIAAGMSDDTIGWIMLSVVAGLASGAAVTGGSLLQTVGRVLAFMVLSFTAGRWLVKRLLDFVQDRVNSRDRLLTLVIVTAFAWGAVSQSLNLEAVLGAFVAGILFGQMRRLPEEVPQKLESITLGIFAPIFFAVAGLKVNVLNLLRPDLLLIALLVIFVASAGKILGTYLGARLIGRRDHWTSLSFGAGLNARGAMEIIIATIGLRLGILNQDMFSIIVLMAMATSLMAPFALRFVLARVTPSEAEAKRLAREEFAAGSLVANIHRVLLPVRAQQGRDLQTIEARILDELGDDLSVTLLTVGGADARAAAGQHLGELAGLFSQAEVNRKVVESETAAEVILDEAAKDYDLLILGASEAPARSEMLFTPLVDYLVRMAPCPTMIVKGGAWRKHWPPQRILVPVSGNAASQNAAELAFEMATRGHEQVTLLNVVSPTGGRFHIDASGSGFERALSNAHDTVDRLREIGEARDVFARTEVEIGPSPETVILEYARKQSTDLIIVGTDVRPGTERLFLGPRIEHILENAPCPVAVFNAP